MNTKDIVIIYLSIQLLILSVFLIRAEKKVSYYQGRESVQRDIDAAVNKLEGK